MYVDNLNEYENQEVHVIGKIEKIDNDLVFLRCGEREIAVRHNGLDSYKTSIVRVKGTVENGVLLETSVHKISDDFDLKLYERFVKVNLNFNSLF